MPADVRRRWDARGGRARGHAPVEQMQRHDLRRRPQPDRLRARHLDGGARAPGRAARGGRVAFRRHGAQQPQRPLRPLRRLDLFFRSLVRPHAGLRRGAAAPARLPGRLSRAARRRRAAAPGQSLHVRSAERDLLLARRAPALRQRHGAGQYPRLRREARRLARVRAHIRERPEIRSRARRPRRHEVRFLRQCLGHGAGRRLGVRAGRRPPRQGGASPSSPPTCIGAARIGAPCSSPPPIRSTRSRPRSVRAWSPSCARARPATHRPACAKARALSPVGTARAAAGAAADAGGAASPRSAALRADHPGHAERRGDGGRRVRGLRLARPIAGSRTPSTTCGASPRRAARAASW